MHGKTERSIHELYQDDPERADAAVFGRKTGVNRRGFLGGSGLAAMSAAVGGAIPFAANMPGGLIPAALAQEKAPRRAERTAIPEIPRQARRAGGARRPSAGGGDAGEPARRRHHADRQVLHPQQRQRAGAGEGCRTAWKLTIDGEVNQKLEITLGELKKRVPPGDAAPGARMRRQRPLVLHADSARQPVDQWRRRLRGMDRRAARRRHARGRTERLRGVHRALRHRRQPVRSATGPRCRAACRSGRRWTRTT